MKYLHSADDTVERSSRQQERDHVVGTQDLDPVAVGILDEGQVLHLACEEAKKISEGPEPAEPQCLGY